jgi:hypothetical protein
MTLSTLKYGKNSNATLGVFDWEYEGPFKYSINDSGDMILTKNYDCKKSHSNTR